MNSYKYWSKATVFNITNICNYNCPECNTLNNWSFHGNEQRWDDYKDIYAEWSNILDIGEFEICGGEATTNPDWVEWVEGIHNLWPNSIGSLRTNGHLLKKDINKFKKLQTLCDKSNGKLFLVISLHNLNRLDEMITVAKEFLGPNWIPHDPGEFTKNFINSYNNIKSDEWPDISSINEFNNLPSFIKEECQDFFNFNYDTQRHAQLQVLIDSVKLDCSLYGDVLTLCNDKNTIVRIGTEHYFFDSVLEYDYEKEHFKFRFNSDPNKSHQGCQERCAVTAPDKSSTVFIKGKMYKCGLSNLLNEFDQQFNIQMSDDDRHLIQNYTPASLDMSNESLDQWFNNMHKKISLCKFCTEDYYGGRHKISAGTKKIFIKKKPKDQR